MPLPALHDDVTLGVLLRERARAIPRRWLFIQCTAGLMQVGVSLFRHPRGWPFFALGGICLVMLALWSLSEQRLVEATSPPTRHALLLWRILRGASAVLGLVSLFALLSALGSGFIGTWIS